MYKNLIKEIESASEPGNEEGLRRFDLEFRTVRYR